MSVRLTYLVDVVRGLLVNIVVYPVVEEQVGVRPPPYERWLRGVIIRIIVDRHLHVIALAYVAPVLLVESVGRILHVSCHEKLASTPRHHYAHAALFRFGYQRQLVTCGYVLTAHLGVAAVGHVEYVIEASEYR